jgi:UDP-glucose 4-epimerase
MDCIINYEKRAYKSRSILKRNEFLLLFGTKFPTKDGTCIRDYIHVVDLAKAHVNALEKKGTYNLAIGKGFSNRDMLKCIVEGAGVELVILSRADEGKIYKIKVKSETPYEIDIIDHSLLKERALYVVEWEKRVGDAPKLIANPDQAKKSLNWCATITPYDKKCMEDVYLSRKKNPGGYDS